MNTDGSVIVSYPWLTSWSDKVVSSCGQKGVTRYSSTSRPLLKICCSAHHSESMYSGLSVQYASSRLTQ